jgi:hypothetical protein
MKDLLSTLLKSLLVGAGYAVTVALTNLLLSRSVDAQSMLWSFAGGTVIGLTLGLLAASVPATRTRHLFVWGSVIFFNIASVTIEGRFFAPNLVQGSMFLLLLQQLVIALAAAWLVVKLFARIEEPTPQAVPRRTWFAWLWRFLVSALAYIFFYYLFGAFNYLLVTGPYYETHAGGLVVPAPDVILKAELIRAPMIVLSIVPFLLTHHASKKRMAFLAGMILFAVGGVAPLLMQVSALPLVLLAASAVEIFLQNYLTGVVSARLLGRPE